MTQGSKWVRWWIFCGILSSGLGEEAHVGEGERVSYPFCMARIGVASLSVSFYFLEIETPRIRTFLILLQGQS